MEPVSTLYFGPFCLDGTDDSLWFNRERCKLTAKSEAVLRYLVAHPGRLVRKADLLSAVRPGLHVSDWVLTTCIREIRQVIGDVARTPQYIATVHRQGYRFIAPVTVVAAPPSTARATLPVKLYPAMDMTFWLPRAEAALAQIGEAARPVGSVPCAEIVVDQQPTGG